MFGNGDQRTLIRPGWGMVGGLGGVVAGSAALLYQVMRRHGETLLRLEELEAELSTLTSDASEAPTGDFARLWRQGMPPGAVAFNFSMQSVTGEYHQLFSMRGQRVLIVFISPDCEASQALLPALSRLPAAPETPSQPRVVIVSTGDMQINQELVRQHGMSALTLVQESNETTMHYYVRKTPSAYLLNSNHLMESGRLEGPLRVLAAVTLLDTPPDPLLNDDKHSLPLDFEPPPPRLMRGDIVPDLRVRSLDGNFDLPLRHGTDRRLVVMFDPRCRPCVDLLPELATFHTDPQQPDVLMITRRDPELTRALMATNDMPYPIAVQQHWDVSRKLGAVEVPAAFSLAPGGRLETDIAGDRTAVSALLKELRTKPYERRLVSLRSLIGSDKAT